MTILYPIVLETEASGAVSAYVPRLPVTPAAEPPTRVEGAIRDVLTAYLGAPDKSTRCTLSERGCQIIAEQSGHVVQSISHRSLWTRALVDAARGRNDVPLCGSRNGT